MKIIVPLLLVCVGVGGPSGCSGIGTGGVVSIGPDVYMIGRLGGMTDYSGSAVKARLFGEASAFCTEKGQVMSPVNGDWSGFGTGYVCVSGSAVSLPEARRRAFV